MEMMDRYNKAIADSRVTGDDARVAAERVIRDVGEPVGLPNAEAQVFASVGIAISTRGAIADDLVRDADSAMYGAKSAGKNCFVEASTEE